MEQGEFSLSEREFSRIKARVYAVAGISLSNAKRTLVLSRLSKIVRALGLPSFDAYVDYLERNDMTLHLPTVEIYEDSVLRVEMPLAAATTMLDNTGAPR